MARPHPLVTKSMRIYYPMNISVFNLVWGYSDDQIPTDILKPNIVERTDPPTKGIELENLIINHGAFPPICPYFVTQQKDTSITEEATKTTQIKGGNIVPSENSLSQVESTTLDTTAEVVAKKWEFFAEFTNKNKIPPPSGGIGYPAWTNRLVVTTTLEYHITSLAPTPIWGNKGEATSNQLKMRITTLITFTRRSS